MKPEAISSIREVQNIFNPDGVFSRHQLKAKNAA
jgi:hypothetical protein